MGVRRGTSGQLLAIVWILAFVSHGSAKVLSDAKIEPLDKFDEFDWNITRIVGTSVKDNVLLSPISIKLVLAMLYEGAQGATSEELQEVLDIEGEKTKDSRYSMVLNSLEAVGCTNRDSKGFLMKRFPRDPERRKQWEVKVSRANWKPTSSSYLCEVSNPGYDLDIGMKLFIDKHATPKKEFVKKISEKYKATLEKIDFSNTAKAVSKINDWAKSVTRGHIEHLVSEADTKETTVLLLLNAVYFKGLWLNPFSPKNTVDGMFETPEKTHIPVEYMVGDFVLEHVESTELKAQMVRLPYVGEKFAMYVVLPNNGTSIEEVMVGMTPTTTRSLIHQMSKTPIVMALPKFNFEFASSLAPFLQQMGIKKIFSTDADLRNIAVGSKDLVVSNVIQKAVIDVNELGTVAAATTSVELVNKFGMQSTMFNVSRTFAFFIKDETTNTVIFVGKVTNPIDPGRSKVSAKPSYAQVASGKPEEHHSSVPLPSPHEQASYGPEKRPSSSPSEQSEPSAPPIPSVPSEQTLLSQPGRPPTHIMKPGTPAQTMPPPTKSPAYTTMPPATTTTSPTPGKNII